MTPNKRSTGSHYEDIAAGELTKRGYRILERNFYSRAGEIDIVASEGGYLVFVEVKYRTKRTSGYPEEAVSHTKQVRICKAALFYMTRYQISEDTPVRVDVVAIDPDEIRVIPNAFEFVTR